MNNAKRILCIISLVTSISLLLVFGILSIVFGHFSDPSYEEEFTQQIIDGTMTTSYNGTPEEQAEFTLMVFKVLSIVFGVFSIIFIICIPISAMGISNSASSAVYIFSIIFGVFGIETLLVAGILGLIINKRKSAEAL